MGYQPANFKASPGALPSKMPTAYAPVKQSPAPVVSTTCKQPHRSAPQRDLNRALSENIYYPGVNIAGRPRQEKVHVDTLPFPL